MHIWHKYEAAGSRKSSCVSRRVSAGVCARKCVECAAYDLQHAGSRTHGRQVSQQSSKTNTANTCLHTPLHSKPYILHPTLYTLHPKREARRAHPLPVMMTW